MPAAPPAALLTPLLAALLLLAAPVAAAAPVADAVPAEPECTAAATTLQLQQAIEAAESAFTAQDLQGFNQANDRIRALLPCLADPITRSMAASIHRSQGLRAFVDGDDAAARQAFAAARSIEPSYSLPTTLVPIGHPARALYDAVDLSEGRWAELAPPRYRLTLDGREERRRPQDWPTIVQTFNADGAVLATTWLGPGEPMPAYEVVLAEGPGGLVLPRPSWPPNPRLVAAGGASLLLAGGLYTAAAVSAHRYQDPLTPPESFDTLRGRANGLVLASAGVGLVAVGLGTSALFVARW